MRRQKTHRGVALLVVLVVVMVITILALGFIERSDMELACGNNAALKTRIEYTAQGGLMLGRALVLAGYGEGSYPRQAFEAGTSEYYDLVIYASNKFLPADPNDTMYTRDIRCTAYKENDGGDRVAETSLLGVLHYDTTAGTGFYKSIQRP